MTLGDSGAVGCLGSAHFLTTGGGRWVWGGAKIVQPLLGGGQKKFTPFERKSLRVTIDQRGGQTFSDTSRGGAKIPPPPPVVNK